mmetsp:Transcript_4541/g.3551  ORF Transcript_4541/g.3551 Transcript_4541/m.3551 type:complete len:141 (-) Transcript_4541:37-459(-)
MDPTLRASFPVRQSKTRNTLSGWRLQGHTHTHTRRRDLSLSQNGYGPPPLRKGMEVFFFFFFFFFGQRQVLLLHSMLLYISPLALTFFIYGPNASSLLSSAPIEDSKYLERMETARTHTHTHTQTRFELEPKWLRTPPAS